MSIEMATTAGDELRVGRQALVETIETVLGDFEANFGVTVGRLTVELQQSETAGTLDHPKTQRIIAVQIDI